MLRCSFKHNNTAQVFMEYVTVIGIVVLVLFAMNTMIKRSLQGMIKSAADQIGNQINAEQKFDDSGHLESQYVSTRVTSDKTTRELMGVTNYVYDETAVSVSTIRFNLGFTETE